jgi:hypothetical protein
LEKLAPETVRYLPARANTSCESFGSFGSSLTTVRVRQCFVTNPPRLGQPVAQGLDHFLNDGDLLLSSTAAQDDGYRVQLIDLAARRGGVYKQSLDRVYELEKQTLGHSEALARLALDHRQLSETHKRDRGVDQEVKSADTQ